MFFPLHHLNDCFQIYKLFSAAEPLQKKWEVAHQVFLQFCLNSGNQLFSVLDLAWKYAHTYHRKGSRFEGEAVNELSPQG